MPVMNIKKFSFTYPKVEHPSLRNINLPIMKNKITALIGPSGCGKSTLLRSMNRIHDVYPGNKYDGKIELLDLKHILDSDIKDISGGELQRVAIAATVIKKANLYVFDEVL